MNATRRIFVLMLAVAGIAGILASDVYAQRGGGRGRRGFAVSRVQLSSLPAVQNNLMLTGEQKTKVNEIAEALSTARREAFQQGGGGDFAARLEQMNKLNAEHTEKLVAVLDEKQRTRLDQLFVQVNGAAALTDQNVAKSLTLTDEQTQKVSDVMAESGQAMRDAFQNQASREERQKLVEERNEKLLAVLTAEQKQSFETMKGDALEIDLSQLRIGGRRGN
jgi:Spy/CpxP family protein refolding chaperone